MSQSSFRLQQIRWFFLIASAVMLYLYWQVIEPFALVLITAAVFGILFAPIEIRVRKHVKNKKLSAILVLVGVVLIVIGPLFGIGALIVEQASDVVGTSFTDTNWFNRVQSSVDEVTGVLPEIIQNEVRNINLVQLGRSAADWAVQNIGSVLSSTAMVIVNTFIFLIALFYFLYEKDKIHKLLIDLSPFRDSLDKKIVRRISTTVRSIILGALIVAFIQAIVATIGMTIFGVPGAVLWGSLVIIAAQIPMLGTSVVLGPAVIYLFLTGDVGAGIGLLIWAVVAVGMIDNLISPFIVGSRTHMNQLLILISILGGLQWLGPIGFIIGPTILAGLMVVVELYKNGILEGGGANRFKGEN